MQLRPPDQTAPGSARDGFVLVAVLWMLAALAILAGVYAIYVRDTAVAFGVHQEKLRAQALAEAGVELAAYQLTSDPQIRPSRGTIDFEFGGAAISVDFRSENARIDLNAAPREVLAGLFAGLGAGLEEATALADRIVAWRAPPSVGSEQEQTLYRMAGRRYGPRHAPFQHVNELGLILGMPPALLDRALPYLTVHSGHREINVLSAAPEVLAALPGLTPDTLYGFLMQRESAPQDVLRARLGSAVRYVTAQPGNTARMVVNVRLNSNFRLRSEAVVLLGAKDAEPFRVLSWHDEVGAAPGGQTKAGMQ